MILPFCNSKVIAGFFFFFLKTKSGLKCFTVPTNHSTGNLINERTESSKPHLTRKIRKRTNQTPHSKSKQPITTIVIIDFSYVNPEKKYTALLPVYNNAYQKEPHPCETFLQRWWWVGWYILHRRRWWHRLAVGCNPGYSRFVRQQQPRIFEVRRTNLPNRSKTDPTRDADGLSSRTHQRSKPKGVYRGIDRVRLLETSSRHVIPLYTKTENPTARWGRWLAFFVKPTITFQRSFLGPGPFKGHTHISIRTQMCVYQ